MKKLLVIVGPTATGKTTLALHLAKVFGGEIISADSRQVYKDMDIGTGKDKPVNSKTKIWGYDLVEPDEIFSVAQYIKIARTTINHLWQKGKLPILVGGTGLYIDGVIKGIQTGDVPPNWELRETLKNESAAALLDILARLDSRKARSLNQSDRRNPRRLIRAIEIVKIGAVPKGVKPLHADVFVIGLEMAKALLDRRINERVEKRLAQSFESEVKGLLKRGVSWQSQAMTSLGYRQWRGYLLGMVTKDQAIIEWQKQEKKYARRQLTWFKRNKKIKWFDPTSYRTSRSFVAAVENTIRKWYA